VAASVTSKPLAPSASDRKQKALSAVGTSLVRTRAVVRALERLSSEVSHPRSSATLVNAAEELRAARRASNDALLDAQEAVDQLTDVAIELR
jgi:hypothetical protein